MADRSPSMSDRTERARSDPGGSRARAADKAASCWSTCASRTKPRSSAFPAPFWCRSRRSTRRRSRHRRPRSRVRLPLRPPFGDRLAGGAGAGLCLWLAISPAAFWPGRPPDCRPRREGTEYTPTLSAALPRCVFRLCAIVFLISAPALPKQRVVNYLQLVGLSRPDGARRFQPEKPASRSATTRSTPTIRSKPSCWPANPATTSSCRPPIFSPARLKPAFFKNSISRSCRTSSMSGRKSPTSWRPTIPAIFTPSTICGGRPASATTSRT